MEMKNNDETSCHQEVALQSIGNFCKLFGADVQCILMHCVWDSSDYMPMTLLTFGSLSSFQRLPVSLL